MRPVRPLGLRSLAWPGLCHVCMSWNDEPVCARCRAVFSPPRARCRRCALPLAAGGPLCGRCLQDAPPFEACVCAVDYAFPWDRLVTGLKFHQQPELASPLAGWLVERADAEAIVSPDLFAPVPLSRARLAERGFDQAWALARQLGRRRHVPARPGMLERRFDGPHQIGLTRRERLANLRGAFTVPARERGRIAQAHVALVDDVLTTGATASHAAQALLDAGARRVDLWVVARTPEPAMDG